ncbi:cytochrome c and c1 heme-lyase [Exidia glandulosa HHB12029]|uniref:Holocytochrome c-type synthase n=1 Tax=Exidia glandulosa HHB12029 TaxID=1314781 RepID=A0A165ZR45_EXIGL|nr:cytochrome c and c1 heme-lyase [Exidia glandulosa HHB12029]
MSKCPVEHDKLPPSHGDASSAGCPVAHGDAQTDQSTPHPLPTSAIAPPSLGTQRVTSSIPRATGGNWEYPSEAQFYAAMARKQHNPRATDMAVVVPIHNAVNERAWMHVLDWEHDQGGDRCGGVKLVSFMGKPAQRSPRARWRTLLGYQPPFDRHDWVVDRCGTRVRYIIDFYTGRGAANGSAPSFYLDCRPALDNWEGVKMRTQRFFTRWFGPSSQPSRAQAPEPASKAQ